MPSDPTGAERSLRMCRDAMIRLTMQVKIGSIVYERASAIIAAMRERGELPWKISED